MGLRFWRELRNAKFIHRGRPSTATAMPDAAARVLSSAVGHRCAYVLSVVVADAWPIARWTVTTSQPAAMSPLAELGLCARGRLDPCSDSCGQPLLVDARDVHQTRLPGLPAHHVDLCLAAVNSSVVTTLPFSV